MESSSTQQRLTLVAQIVGGLVLILVVFYTFRDILSAPLIGIGAFYLLYPYRQNPFVGRACVLIVLLILLWFVAEIRDILMPFAAALLLAYLLNPLIKWLAKHKIPRLVSILLIFGSLGAGLTVAGVFIIPRLIQELQKLLKAVPGSLQAMLSWAEEYLWAFFQRFGLVEELQSFRGTLTEAIARRGEEIFQALLKATVELISNLGAVIGTVSQLLNLVLIPIVTIYLLKDFDVLGRRVRGFFPPRHIERVTGIYKQIDHIVGKYIRGQLLVTIVVGVLTSSGLALLGVDFALLLGVTAGVLNLIPYAGLIVSLLFAILVTLFSSSSSLLTIVKVLVTFAIVQTLENTVVSPRIVGREVGLHPVWVILSILVFAHFMGIWGLLVGVPVAAVISAFGRRMYQSYIRSSFYLAKPRDRITPTGTEGHYEN